MASCGDPHQSIQCRAVTLVAEYIRPSVMILPSSGSGRIGPGATARYMHAVSASGNRAITSAHRQ
jgi:hypothetical protein